jgi:D-alanine-D-alanine ligase
MKITVLTSVETVRPTQDDLDVVVSQVVRALRKLGHSVSVLPLFSDVPEFIKGLSRRKPELVFNMAEMFGDSVMGDMLVAALLETQEVRYTGGGPGDLYLSQDKGLSKKLLDYEGILYPRFAVFSQSEGFETGGNLRMPLFVKPLRADASIGIAANSLVHDTGSQMKRDADINS